MFDLDGTLLNTLQDLTDSVNRSLGYLGFPPYTPEVFRYFVGDGRETMAMRSLPECNRDEATINKLVALINKEYSQHWADTTRLYPGVADLLDNLTIKSIKMAILSNKPHIFTEEMVSRLLSRWHFEIVAGAMPPMPVKPDPKAALQIAKRLDIIPSDFLYLGDSEVDMRTANAGGMYAVGAAWGFRTEDELKASGAKALIRHPLELLKLI